MAAILAADVVGYSRLMGKDEEATLAALKAHREIIDGLIAEHGGRIFGSAGDSVIAEFASPVEAVRSATEIQLAIHHRNSGLPERERMLFRIGINLGDVLADGDNLMGDGVNVAARLEALAPPGGIYVSEPIHTHVRDRLSLDFLDMGEHRVKNITRPVRVYRVPLASEDQARSPFRGLDVFDFDHADIFFGRARPIATCVDRVEQLVASGRAFLLIYGMSGSGKSSLLRAGLLPAILRPGATAGIVLWRRCLIRPSEGSDTIASFVAGLLQESALPELANERTAAELAELIRGAPDRVPALIRAALAKAAAAANVSAAQARLVLAVDQMEELFTTQTGPAREAFIRLLASLATSGLVWVIATIRADFFHRCGEVAGFSALKDGLGSYELLPPTGAEIAQIIREPARAAGLRFEETADQGRLDDVLQAAAGADPESLPLLEFVLDALHDACRDRRILTFAAYRALGGLEGAIARRADEVADALPAHVQDTLPAVLRSLTTVRLGDESIAAVPALATDVAGTPAQAELVDALIAARLLVSDEDAEGRAVVRVAHESLLTRWPRALNLVNANREFLETRARVQTDGRRWHSDKRNPDLLLPAGKRLVEAEELLLSRRDEIDGPTADYIQASSLAVRENVKREQNAERARMEAEAAAATLLARRTRYAAVAAILLAAIAGVGAVAGFLGQREAERQAVEAKNSADQARTAEGQALEARQKAIEARDEALRSQSLALAFLSQQTAASGDIEAAILLALEALRPKDTPPGQRLVEAEAALYNALLAHRQLRIFRHDAGATWVAFSPKGDRIVTASYDKTARIWNVSDGSAIAVLKGHEGALERASFSPDGNRVVTAARDSTVRVWDAKSGAQLFVVQQPGGFPTAKFSPDGTRVLTASDDNNHAMSIWDARNGANILTLKGGGTSFADFSPDGYSFAAGQGNSRTVGIWITETGEQIKNWRIPNWPDEVVFSPNGNRLLVTSWSPYTYAETSGLWDVTKGTEIAALGGHKSDTHSGTFSHDGRLATTVSIDGTARLWDGVTGKLRNVLGEETPGLRLTDVTPHTNDQEVNSAFSHDDKLLATASMDGGVRVWDVENASLLTSLSGHHALVEHVEFSPVDNTLLTASHDGTARLWDIDGILTDELLHKYSPNFAVFSPDNIHLVTGGGDSLAHLWDVAGAHETAELETHEPLQATAFSPDGHRLATATLSGEILIWDVDSGRQLRRLEMGRAAVASVQFSPDGKLVGCASLAGVAQLWGSDGETATLKTSATLPNAVFSPDGRLVLTATSDNIVHLLRTDGTEVRTFVGHRNGITSAAFSQNGLLVATGSLDQTARIWSLEDGSTVQVLQGHDEPLTDVAFSPDGQSLLTASRDSTARIWNVADGTRKAVLKGHRGAVESARFSPNGIYIVTTSSQDRTVRVWATASGREIATISERQDKLNRPKVTRAAMNSKGTAIAVVSGDERVRIIRAFPTSNDLIDYAKTVVPRQLTPCERRRFFLPGGSDVPDCPG
ncbi:AAA family ATPase [Mesorhizobium sp. M1227]|uniref:nSTAND1 domain-containing NTPase n=1 Tax=Mesorhizobium sp. M1227 TaxID=2957071 RepID=UPI0033391C25